MLVWVLIIIVLVTGVLIFWEVARPWEEKRKVLSAAEAAPLPPQSFRGWPPLPHQGCGPRLRPPTHSGVCPSLSQYYDWDGRCKWRPKFAHGMEVARGNCEYPGDCPVKGDICTRFGSCQKPFDL